MPPTHVHFNGGVNLPDAETVMREITSRVPIGVRRIPDGETGDRQQWIFFQLQKFWSTPGLEKAAQGNVADADYQDMPKVRLADGVDADSVQWPDVGYAAAYRDSYGVFRRLRDEGVVPAGVRFQVEYPTPLASVGAWVVPEQQLQLEASYERAVFADLDRLLADVPREDLAVQWDVASEFGLLEGSWVGKENYSFEGIVQRLARCVGHVPSEVPVGVHLCYGDYGHRHFAEPSSLNTQVRLVNALAAAAHHDLGWVSFTVPQHQRDPGYFEPLARLQVSPETELNVALVPYHPDTQESGTTEEQVRLIDARLGEALGTATPGWGISTECGMARAEREEVPGLLDQHTQILTRHG